MRRVIAPFSSLVFVCAAALAAAAQGTPPTPLPSSVPTSAPIVSPGASPGASPSPAPGASGEVTTAPSPTPVPYLFAPTQPPIVADPPQVAVEPGKQATTRLNSVLGNVNAVVADPTIATVVVDQLNRILFVTGVKVGETTVTLSDTRGVTLLVPVRVAYAAGTAADYTSLRITGNPASAEYVRDAIAEAVERATTLRPGASANVNPDAINVRRDLQLDDRFDIDVPVTMAGDGYLNVAGNTRISVENVALPPIEPQRLLVSDFPEKLSADGVLFTARLERDQPQRFLYYHYNPGTEPARRILLKAHNDSAAPATIQLIDGSAGPGANEMEVGHLATKRFLVRQARNEGLVMTIAPGATINLVDHPLPPQNIVSAIMQLRLVVGDGVDLALVAQDANTPLDQSADTTQLLSGSVPHARGAYPVPTFYFDRTYDVNGDDLEIPIGQLPLPNLRQGQALAGDYGVEQSMNIVIVNATRGPHAIALYANPRGGRATGTFIIDGTLVQAHALPTFSKFKIWQETISAGTYRRIRIVTMPEGGSFYPLRLIFAPDDGSVAPGGPGSPIY